MSWLNTTFPPLVGVAILIPAPLKDLIVPLGCGVAMLLLVGIFLIGLRLMDWKITPRLNKNDATASNQDERLAQQLKTASGSLLRIDFETRPYRSWIAPYVSLSAALVAWSALAFGPTLRLAELNAGLLFVVSVSSLGILSLAIRVDAPWTGQAANDAARRISFQATAVLALISALLLPASLGMKDIVQAQSDQGAWFIFYAPIAFALYFGASIAAASHGSSATADPNHHDSRNPSSEDRDSGEQLWLRAEYTNMIVIAEVITTVFLGGWLRPFLGFHDRFLGTQIEMFDAFPALLFLGLAAYCARAAQFRIHDPEQRPLWLVAGSCLVLALFMFAVLFASPEIKSVVQGPFWFSGKMALVLYGFLRIRATVRRCSFEGSMRFVWRFAAPLAIVNLIAVAASVELRQQWNFSPILSVVVTTVATIGAAVWLWTVTWPEVELDSRTVDVA